MSAPAFIPLKKVQFELLKHNQALEKYYQQRIKNGKLTKHQAAICILYDKAIVTDLANVIARKAPGTHPDTCKLRKAAFRHFCDKLEMYRQSKPVIIHTGKATEEQISYRLACLDQAKTIIQDIAYTGHYYAVKPVVQASLFQNLPERNIQTPL